MCQAKDVQNALTCASAARNPAGRQAVGELTQPVGRQAAHAGKVRHNWRTAELAVKGLRLEEAPQPHVAVPPCRGACKCTRDIMVPLRTGCAGTNVQDT